jgi:hypothetical protein
MKYLVTWREERGLVIDAENAAAAEEQSVAMMVRLGKVLAVRLLSIVPIGNPPDGGATPTPFGRPPSGTLGGGQATVPEELPDVMAKTA